MSDNLPPQPKGHDGYFMGYAGHEAVMLVWIPKTKKIVRVADGRVDEFGSGIKDEALSPSEYLLRNHPFMANSTSPDILKLIKEPKLSIILNPIDPTKCITIDVTLPSSKTLHLGIMFEDDEHHGIPMLVDIEADSPLLPFIEIGFIRRKHHVVSINRGVHPRIFMSLKKVGPSHPHSHKFGKVSFIDGRSQQISTQTPSI
jgi:hypothetical protein